MSEESLNNFHPLIQEWFTESVGTPTGAQTKAWPVIAENKNVVVTAPTGSGKTLTAFLWAVNCLVTGEWQTGTTRVLYISPLKALNNDIRKNLSLPLDGIKEKFLQNDLLFPEIRVMTRSGGIHHQMNAQQCFVDHRRFLSQLLKV